MKTLYSISDLTGAVAMRKRLNQKEIATLVSLSRRINGLSLKFNTNDVELKNNEKGTVGCCLNVVADALETILREYTNNDNMVENYAENNV